MDPAADGVERREEDDERQVLDDRDVEDRVERVSLIEPDERDGQGDAPGQGDLGMMPAPEVRRGERQESNREEDAREGERAPRGEGGAEAAHRSRSRSRHGGIV